MPHTGLFVLSVIYAGLLIGALYRFWDAGVRGVRLFLAPIMPFFMIILPFTVLVKQKSLRFAVMSIAEFPIFLTFVGIALRDKVMGPISVALTPFFNYQRRDHDTAYAFSDSKTHLVFSIFEKGSEEGEPIEVPFENGEDMLQKIHLLETGQYQELFALDETTVIDRALLRGVIFRSEREDGTKLIAEGFGRRRAAVHIKPYQ